MIIIFWEMIIIKVTAVETSTLTIIFSFGILKGIGHLEDICRCIWEDNIKMAATKIGRRMPTGFV
jgi:hypothetical protein